MVLCIPFLILLIAIPVLFFLSCLLCPSLLPNVLLKPTVWARSSSTNGSAISPHDFTQWKCDVYMYRFVQFFLGWVSFHFPWQLFLLILLSPCFPSCVMVQLLPCILKGNGTLSKCAYHHCRTKPIAKGVPWHLWILANYLYWTFLSEVQLFVAKFINVLSFSQHLLWRPCGLYW